MRMCDENFVEIQNMKKSSQSWISSDFDDAESTTMTKKRTKSAFNSARTKKRPRRFLDDDESLWSTKHAPKSVQDLAVHPKKVQQVRDWLSDEAAQKAPFLLLRGPSGSGKTATVKALADDINADVLEWVNPVELVPYEEDSNCDLPYVSQMRQFKHFLLTANK